MVESLEKVGLGEMKMLWGFWRMVSAHAVLALHDGSFSGEKVGDMVE